MYRSTIRPRPIPNFPAATLAFLFALAWLASAGDGQPVTPATTQSAIKRVWIGKPDVQAVVREVRGVRFDEDGRIVITNSDGTDEVLKRIEVPRIEVGGDIDTAEMMGAMGLVNQALFAYRAIMCSTADPFIRDWCYTRLCWYGTTTGRYDVAVSGFVCLVRGGKLKLAEANAPELPMGDGVAFTRGFTLLADEMMLGTWTREQKELLMAYATHAKAEFEKDPYNIKLPPGAAGGAAVSLPGRSAVGGQPVLGVDDGPAAAGGGHEYRIKVVGPKDQFRPLQGRLRVTRNGRDESKDWWLVPGGTWGPEKADGVTWVGTKTWDGLVTVELYRDGKLVASDSTSGGAILRVGD